MKIKDICLSALFAVIMSLLAFSCFFTPFISIAQDLLAFWEVSNLDLEVFVDQVWTSLPDFFAVLIVALIFKKFFIYGPKSRIILTGYLLFIFEVYSHFFMVFYSESPTWPSIYQDIYRISLRVLWLYLPIRIAVTIVIYLGKKKQKLLAASSDARFVNFNLIVSLLA